MNNVNVAVAPIAVFVTNLGKYNEGELVGEWLNLPTTPEQLKETFKKIGIDNKDYEEYFISDYESTLDGLKLPEYANLDGLNYLAVRLEDMSSDEIDRYQAILAYQDTDGVEKSINLTYSLDSFEVLSDVHTEEELGYYYIEECGSYDLKSMGELARYIDYEGFGRDIMINESGSFTEHGYIYENGDISNENGDISNEYDGVHVPEEYCIVACNYEDTDVPW